MGLYYTGGITLTPYKNDNTFALIGLGLKGVGTIMLQAAPAIDKSVKRRQEKRLGKKLVPYTVSVDMKNVIPVEPVELEEPSDTVSSEDILKSILNRETTLACGGHLFADAGKMETKTGNAMNKVGAGLGAAGDMLNAFGTNSSLNESAVNGALGQTQNGLNYRVTSNSFDSLLKDLEQFTALRNNYGGRDFRSSDGQRISSTLSATASGASAGAMIGGPWGAVIGGVLGLGSGIAGMITGNSKARELARKMNQMNNTVNAINRARFNSRANVLRRLLAKSYARGYYDNGGILSLAGVNLGDTMNNSDMFADGGSILGRGSIGAALMSLKNRGSNEGTPISNQFILDNGQLVSHSNNGVVEPLAVLAKGGNLLLAAPNPSNGPIELASFNLALNMIGNQNDDIYSSDPMSDNRISTFYPTVKALGGDLNIAELSEGLEIDGLTQELLKLLRESGVEFDIIG